MITLDDYIGDKKLKYPSDYTQDIEDNAKGLLSKVNLLLTVYSQHDTYFKGGVSSGWRPKAYNDTIPGAAKRSNHITGHAVDIRDPNNTLNNWCLNNQENLVKCGLYMEHPLATKGWCHLQDVSPGSNIRVFRP